jgi:hypothetical protein
MFYFANNGIAIIKKGPTLFGAGSTTACSQLSNSIFYSNAWFAALDGMAPSESSISCQTSYIQPPNGWILAPDNAVSQGVIRAYPWGTHVMVVAGGNSYGTSMYNAGLFQSSALTSDGVGRFKPLYCSLGILIQCSQSNAVAPVAVATSSNCTPCPAGSYSNATGVWFCKHRV